MYRITEMLHFIGNFVFFTHYYLQKMCYQRKECCMVICI